MIKFKSDLTHDFIKDLKKIKFNFGLQKRLGNKIEEIIENPNHYKPLRNVLKNRRRAHIGNYVLIFEINERDKAIIFHSFRHHDEAYKQ
jgi:YafQ family addiction module toxin component